MKDDSYSPSRHYPRIPAPPYRPGIDGPAEPPVVEPALTYEVTDPDHVLPFFLSPIAGVTGEVEDLPRSQLEINDTRIRAWIASGGRNSPGLRVFKA